MIVEEPGLIDVTVPCCTFPVHQNIPYAVNEIRQLMCCLKGWRDRGEGTVGGHRPAHNDSLHMQMLYTITRC